MTTHAFCDACLLEKIAMQMSFGSKIFPNFAPCFGPQNGGWKMDPKMAPEFDPQNGGPKMAPKMGSKNGTQKIVKMKIKLWFLLDQDIGPLLGAIFGPPFWWSNSGTIFGSIFQPPFWGPKHGAKFGKNLLPKLICIAILVQQTCITKCMCSHCLASCSSEHNLILHLAKTRKITKSWLPQMLHMSKMDYSLRIWYCGGP